MKIAIRGHKTRGQEVIEILKSLGGKQGVIPLQGDSEYYIYFIREDLDNLIVYDVPDSRPNYKKYTLEEFEKEFPFKVGDTVINNEGNEGFITGLITMNNKILYSVKYNYNQFGTISPNLLKLKKKEMNTRNITLTLDKAKEWYKKEGELREVALQAYSEEELTKVELPKNWKEFCTNYRIQAREAIIQGSTSKIDTYKGISTRDLINDRNVCPSQKSAEAHLALIQLEQLRDCWRQGWVPKKDESVYTIKFSHRGLGVYMFCSREFLSFPTEKMAEEFLKCFRDLIEKAGDLI